MDLAAAERERLCDLLLDVGPDAPTLCEGWTTRDLTAHLLVREREPWAAVGVLLPAAAAVTEGAQARVAARPYEENVALLRSGPPAWSPLGLPGVRGAANLLEFYVHHEDVRRPAGGGPRRDTAELDDALWGRLGFMGRVLTRHVRGVEVHLVSRDGRDLVARRGGPVVTVTGTPRELVVYLFGRREQAEVDVTGDPAAAAALAASRLGL